MNIDTIASNEVDVPEDTKKTLSGDDARLLAMGKKPELRRVYNTWTCQFRLPMESAI